MLVVLLQKRAVLTGYLEAQSMKRTRGLSDQPEVGRLRETAAGTVCSIRSSCQQVRNDLTICYYRERTSQAVRDRAVRIDAEQMVNRV